MGRQGIGSWENPGGGLKVPYTYPTLPYPTIQKFQQQQLLGFESQPIYIYLFFFLNGNKRQTNTEQTASRVTIGRNLRIAHFHSDRTTFIPPLGGILSPSFLSFLFFFFFYLSLHLAPLTFIRFFGQSDAEGPF